MFNDTIKITDEFIMMLNHAKMISTLNNIEFDTDSYILLRDDCINDIVDTEIYSIPELLYSAYLASIEIKKSNKLQISNHEFFLKQLDNAIDKLYVIPTF